MQNYTLSPQSPMGGLKFSHSMEFSPYGLDTSLHRVPSLQLNRSYTICHEIDSRAGIFEFYFINIRKSISS